MELFKQAIREQASVMSDQVLNLDRMLTQQVDPALIMAAGEEFARRFRDESVTKVATIESSGISLAFATALSLGVPMIFARRRKTLLSDQDVYVERIPAITKGIVTDLVVSKKLLEPGDRVLIIDDIIANGDAARGLYRILQKAGVTVAGLGVAVEKTFQIGGKWLREQGIRVESLVRIVSLGPNEIEME